MTTDRKILRFKARQAGLAVSEFLPAPKSPPKAVQTPCKTSSASLPGLDLTHRALFPRFDRSRLPDSGPAVLTLP